MSKKQTIHIRGMHCASCEILIGEEIKKITGVEMVSVHHKTGVAEIVSKHGDIANENIVKAVETAGYEVGTPENLTWFSHRASDYLNLLTAIIVVILLYTIMRATGIAELSIGNDPESSLWVVLLVGLVAGISTCMALIGGLVLALSARHAELHPEATHSQKFRPHLFFNLGRIGGYAILGGLIGWLGSAIQLSSRSLGFLTLIVGLVMLLLGVKLMDIFPILKNKTIALPSGLARKLGIHREEKEYSHRAAMIAGALTFFLPCGFTQSMQLYAITTGSVTKGALIMGIFALGTAPGLLGVGGLSSVLKGRKAKLFFAVAGIIVLLLGWYNIKVGGRLLNTPEANESIMSSVPADNVPAPQLFTTTYTNADGLSPSDFSAMVGKPTRLDIAVKDNGRGCGAYITIGGLVNRQQLLKAGTTVSFTFTPKKPGRYPIMCGMGMITFGYVTVK